MFKEEKKLLIERAETVLLLKDIENIPEKNHRHR